MLHLMHTSYHATNVMSTKQSFDAIAAWLDDKIAADPALEPAERKDPASLNLLRNVLIDDEPPLTADRNAVQRFCEIVESAAAAETGDRELADAALEVSQAMKALADEHDPVHLLFV